MGAFPSRSKSTDLTLCNVYIFNKIKNNEQDVQLLRETFEALECSVTEIKNNSYAKLRSIVTQIIENDYSNFNYLVIIVLDNTNKEDSIWTTTDGKNFHINGDLLTAIYANKHLMGKLRFSIIQNNRTFTNAPPIIRIPSSQISYQGKDLKYYATSTGCVLQHDWSKGDPSPFIRILCEEIREGIRNPNQRPISKVLDTVSTRIEDLTNELPGKETNFIDAIVLGRAIN